MPLLKSRFTCVLFFLLSLVKLQAQTSDSLKILKLGEASLHWVYQNPDTARQLVDQALVLCAKPENASLRATTYNYLGIYYDVAGIYDSAHLTYRKAAEIAKEQGNKKTLAASYNNIGLLHWNLNELAQAAEYFFYSSKIYEELDDQKGLANTYSNIGLVFEDQRRPKDAMTYTRLALNIRLQIKDSVNLGKSYSNIGLLIAEMGQYDSGIYYHRKALEYFRSADDLYGLGTCYHNLGTDYHLMHNLDSALKYAEKALAIRLKLGNKKYIAATQSLLGNVYYSKKEYGLSEASYKQAIQIYERYNVQGELWKVYNRMVHVFEGQGKVDSAFRYLQKRVEISDTLMSMEKFEKLYEIEEKYESEKAKRELAESQTILANNKQQKQLLWFGLALAGLLLLFAVIWIQARIKKSRETKQHELLLQKLEISQELHDNIGSQLTYMNLKLGELKKDSTEERGKVDELKSFASRTIADLRSSIWGLSQEVTCEALSSKIATEVQKVQNMGSEVRFHSECKTNKILDSITSVNVLRITQEALQNAVKHANAKSIEVKFVCDDTSLELTIQDDGVGIQNIGNGFGMEFMKQRAAKINAKMVVTSKDTGTTIQLVKNKADGL